MFVSLLQLMGFPLGTEGPDRRREKGSSGRAVPDNQGINRDDEGAASPPRGRSAGRSSAAAGADEARRRELKAQPKAAAKAGKSMAKAKTAKAAAKPVAKKPAARKPAAKAPAKAAKPAAKAPAKKAAPVKTSKPAAKPVAKAPAKAAAKAPAKAPVKAPAKAPAPPAAKKAAAAPAKAEKPAAKAPPAPAAKIPPARAGGAAVPAASPPKASTPPVPVAARPPAAPAPATAARSAPAPALSAPSAAKASYIPMANPSVLTPPPLVAIKKDPKLANNWKTKGAEELSDAEVLAMPDGEYMNDKQMAFFRLKLQQLKQDILNSAGETTEHLREDTVIVPDPADRATIEEEHALELRTRDRERKLLKKIEQSIARIDAGDYGYCDETGEPIGVGRLLARPTATLSLEAQQRRELKQKMFGD
jgi:DnaK suppressor protein